ncbi:PilW family protein [Thermoproteota archaeon]
MLKNKKNGVTLIEFMVALVITGVLLGITAMILSGGRNTWRIGEASLEVQQNLRQAMAWINEEVCQTGIFKIEGSLPADGFQYPTIVFQKVLNVNNGFIEWDPDSIQYYLGGQGGKQLIRLTDSGEEKVLADNVVNFQAKRKPGSPEIVEFRIEIQKMTIENNMLQTSLDFKVKMRN